ncbi:MAG: xanthine dehydrogenase family protein subunit M, partial [Pseudomonadota bacterium]
STFVKLGARKYLVISIAMVAARLVSEAGVVREAAISVGACGAVATRLKRAEAALVGVPIGPELMAPLDDDMLLDGLSPIDDVRGDAGYRLRAANALVRRAISQLASEGNA